MFKPVSPKLNLTLLEEGVLRYWKTEDIFKKSSARREGGREYVFYEGPPTANGVPGVHHVLARAFKDIFPRYKTMRGYHVIRRGGWDTHGLPVEIEVEKRLGFTSKAQIEAFGIDRFNERCRRSAFEYIREWEKLTDRIAFWVDLENAYITYTNEYIESVWWILKQLWDKNLLYEGYKVVPYCPRCGTPLSDHEVALGYRKADDPSIYVRLPLVGERNTSLLVWTTTPWTLPGNVAVAAHPEETYVKLERELPEGGSEKLILAEALVATIFGGEAVKVLERFKGSRLKGARYQPLFTFLLPDKPAYYVILEDYVTTEDGTGLVHIAPAFGAEDMGSAKKHNLPVPMTVNEEGAFVADVRPWRGVFVKDADPLILQDLEARGLVFKAGTYTHTYPFCWRCDTPLLYYARSTWYLRTTSYKEELVALNQGINWVPEHVKTGRFGNWLENNVDWALGRERYWGTPLPIWRCTGCDHRECIDSIAGLEELSKRDLTKLDLHRPYVDEVIGYCPKCGGTMNRVPELIDVWFDSGSMPVAQWHYPFENQETFKEQYPADFICEAVDQTRGWFYSLHAISTLLFEQVSFENVICLGLILDEKGQKMSKSRGNIVDPWDVLKVHGADAFRWYLYTASAPGQERRFSVDLVGEVVRNFSLTLWNVYSFFMTYASLDQWEPGAREAPLEYNHLDRWLRSELHGLVRDVTTAFELYDVPAATRPIQDFVEGLSNWYLRRSRRRFWKGESDADKNAAYATLYEALVTISKLLAPTMPFMAEELYQNLVRPVDQGAAESIHLVDWPIFDDTLIDETLNQDMRLVMKLASLGHAARNRAGIKVRQPLSEASFSVGNRLEMQTLNRYADLLAEELNVKDVRPLGSAGEAVFYSLNPLPKQLGQKYKGTFPDIRDAILDLDAEGAARALLDGHQLLVSVGGQAYKILPEEVEVRVEARSGLTVASEGAYLAVLKTALTDELVYEGLSREFIRRVQDLRRQADFNIADRIRIKLISSPKLTRALEIYRDTIMGETLAVELSFGEVPLDATTIEFDGERATLELVKA